jgi:lipid-binding SYLF domain-containing protein
MTAWKEDEMRRKFAAIVFSLSAGLALLGSAPGLEARSASKEEDRLNNSALVMKEAMGMPSGIPQGLLEKAYCVIVIPSAIKGAFGVGASYGRGAMSCRGGEDFKGPWSPPTMMALEGGSAGFQVGGQATDFVLLVMNKRGASSILSGKFKIGGDAAASAGPIGRDTQANLDVYMRTTILTYSRSRGLFAGVSLEGSTLRPDNKANKRLYGKEVSAKSIVLDSAVPTPAAAEKLISTLNQYGKNPAATSGSAHTAPSSTPNRPPVGSCYANPVQVTSGSGDTVAVQAIASDPDNDPLTYTWTATAGTIEGSGSQVRWNPAGVAAGGYSVTVRVDDGRGGSVSCVAQVLVASRPPTMTCSASPSSVHPGDRVHITATASDPDNDPLTFTWESNGGRIVGSGAEVELDTTGVEPSRYTVTGKVTGGRGGSAECRAEFNVEAPRPAE